MPNLIYMAENYDTYNSSIILDENFDEVLSKIMFVDFATYGFKRLESMDGNPIDILTLDETGNFVLDYYINGPDELLSVPSINLRIQKTDSIKTFIIIHMLDVHYRHIGLDNDGNEIDSGWKSYSCLSDIIYIGNAAPVNPNPSSIWIDTTIDDYPTFYLYNAVNEWISIGSLNDTISEHIYDITGKREDIFEYFERLYGIPTVTNPITDTITFYNLRYKFAEHLNLYGHMTLEERAIYLDLISKEEFAILVEESKAILMEYINDKLESIDADLILSTIENNRDLFKDHIQNVHHITRDEYMKYMNKADGDHEHIDINNVQIRGEDIIDGILSLNVLPDSVKHILKRVNTHENRFNLTINDVQNGDSVYVAEETDLYPAGLYLVYDDTKLNFDSGYIYYRTKRLGNIDFDDINNKPDTLTGYGITDGLYVHKDNNEEFVYPYTHFDRSFNWLITKLCNRFDAGMTRFLDHLEKLIQDESVSGIHYRNKVNSEKEDLITRRWNVYRYINGLALPEQDSRNLDKISEIEALYAKAYDLIH